LCFVDPSISQSDGYEFVLNVGVVFGGVHLTNLFFRGFNFGPLIDFKSAVLFNNIRVSVAQGNNRTFFDNIELVIISHQFD
jgi:hypothetical protein